MCDMFLFFLDSFSVHNTARGDLGSEINPRYQIDAYFRFVRDSPDFLPLFFLAFRKLAKFPEFQGLS